ncbi:hypothetical protein GCM10023153_19980 [Ornithinibacter aureus]|uniref:Uncharacterized protein n=1 Tax=Ornithinibacter aureus TaxID=622664 RepID=A0ABP8JVH2_9MICO|nr:hypothetical protein C8E84_3484 [Ornithinibacter aureus]
MSDNAHRAPLSWRVWVCAAFGVVVGGGAAFDYVGQGDYVKAVVGGIVCVASLAVIAWGLDDRA